MLVFCYLVLLFLEPTKNFKRKKYIYKKNCCFSYLEAEFDDEFLHVNTFPFLSLTKPISVSL